MKYSTKYPLYPIKLLKNLKQSLLLNIGRGLSAFHYLRSRTHPQSLEELRYDRPISLYIPTYEGTAQAVHPDIVPPGASNPLYVLAFTPYPFSYDQYENPSILISQNGIRFQEEQKGLNPLSPPPPIDHNDDPDLFYENGSWYLIYLETVRPSYQQLVLLQSPDRLRWGRSNLATYHLEGGDPLIVSPSLIRHGNTISLFYVNRSVSPYRIEYLESNDIRQWNIHHIQIPQLEGIGFTPWHLDIFKGARIFYMLLTSVTSLPGRGRVYDLHIACSTDLKKWTCSRRPVFPSKSFYWRSVYRGTGFCRNGDLFIYYSYETRLRTWRIGLVRKRIKDLFPAVDEEASSCG